MTDLTAPPTDRATCGWLPLPVGPPPSPPPDRADHRPPEPPASPPAGTRADPPPEDPVEPAAVQAALETLTRWLRSGGTLVCASGGPGDAGPPDGAAPGSPDDPAAGSGADPRADPGADPVPDPADRACRHCRRSVDPVRVRAWARERGLGVADRGRLPAAIVTAYLAAHPHA